MNEEDMFGTANYDAGSSNGGGNQLKVQGGKPGEITHNVFRIVPPILEQRASGRIVLYEPVHWGYYGVASDPTKSAPRTFVCPQERDFRTGEIIVQCDECAMIQRLSDERESLCPSKNVKKAVRDQALAKLSPADRARVAILDIILDGQEQGRGAHKVDSKRWKINAITRDGKAGGLRLSSTVWGLLKARKGEESTKPGLIDKYRHVHDMVDPAKGLWFDIVRTGNGGFGDGGDKVIIVTQRDPNDPLMERPIPAPLTPEMIQAIHSGCRDLSDCAPSVRATAEQVSELVAAYENDRNTPEEVDRILGTSRRTQAAPRAQVSTNFRPPAQDNPNDLPAFNPAAPAAPAVQVAAAPPASVAAPAATPGSPPATAVTSELSPDIQKLMAANPKLAEFLAKYPQPTKPGA